jgi:ABC-type transport system involved in multi-copper enzyme maturation permease subunit
MTTTPTVTPYRSTLEATGRDGFAQLLRAEWTKFRTVRRWVLGMVAAVLVTVLISLLGAAGNHVSNNGEPVPKAPDGTVVTDSFGFVHRTLTGNGSITARVRSLTGSGSDGALSWAKAGIMIKAGTKQGAGYVALMVTPGHGVRLQYDFTHDLAGPSAEVSAASPRWLRLTRAGSAYTGYESADGTHWTEVGTVRPAAIPAAAQAGVFVTTPMREKVTRAFGSTSVVAGGASATGVLDHVDLTGDKGQWAIDRVGHGDLNQPDKPAGSVSGDTFTVNGTGDIAPDVSAPDVVGKTLGGVLLGLLVVIAVATLFITAEYRRDMMRTTLAASPRRGRVVAAKAVVIGAVTFLAGLVATCVSYPLALHSLRKNGFAPYAAHAQMAFTNGTVMRVVIGSALLLALAAVLALALGVVLRSSAGAITLVAVLVVLPQILSYVLPLTAGHWLLRLTPAAAFAIQQGTSPDAYPQVAHACLPEGGCYPLSPWSGLGVLGVYAAVALALAVWRLNRRDA